MNETISFWYSEHLLALIVAFLIFLITIFLVVKQWIGFSIALLLLLFSLAAGLIINNQHSFKQYFNSYALASSPAEDDHFRKQMVHAVEDLKLEMNTEKENLQRVMNQVQVIVDSFDEQKQKLQHFIEETRERFKTEYSLKSSPTGPASLPQNEE